MLNCYIACVHYDAQKGEKEAVGSGFVPTSDPLTNKDPRVGATQLTCVGFVRSVRITAICKQRGQVLL